MLELSGLGLAGVIFSMSQMEKLWNQSRSPKFFLHWRQCNAWSHRMSESLLDECHESIVKIAETQSPDGKRAILAMARIFRANSGPAASKRQASPSQAPQRLNWCSNL
jgi:hypothetical protein